MSNSIDHVDPLDQRRPRRHAPRALPRRPRPSAAPAPARRGRRAQVERLHLIVPHVGDDAAERRGHAGKARHQRALEPDLPDHRAHMQRAAAAERHADESSRDRGRARSTPAGSRPPCAHWRRARCASAASSTSSPSGAPTWSAIAAWRPRRRDAPTSPPIGRVGVDAAEHDVGIGQRRPLVALAVAGRPRHRAGAFRPDLQQPAAIDRRDRAAAGADGRDLDHRRADDQAEIDGRLRRERRLAAGNHRDVERSAAEVAGDDVVVARRRARSPRQRSRRPRDPTARCGPEAAARSPSTSRRRSTARCGTAR